VVENYPKFKVLDYWKMNPTDFQTYLEWMAKDYFADPGSQDLH
jgi:hypothetical protein